MIYFPVKSLPNSANPSGISRYKIRKNNPLHFQHLQNSSDLFILKPLKPPLDSTLTRPLSLTPVESTLTKNRGEGVGVVLVSLTKNSRNLVYPERLSRGASLFACPESFLRGVYPRAVSRKRPHSLPLFAKSETHPPSFQSFAHSLFKTPGCTPIVLYPEGFLRGARTGRRVEQRLTAFADRTSKRRSKDGCCNPLVSKGAGFDVDFSSPSPSTAHSVIHSQYCYLTSYPLHDILPHEVARQIG